MVVHWFSFPLRLLPFFENNGVANGRKLTEMEGIIGNKVLKCVLLARIEDLFSKNSLKALIVVPSFTKRRQ